MFKNRYSKKFYAGISHVGAKSAGTVVPKIMELCHPSSIVDVGCGSGTWLAEFEKNGVADYVGYDGIWVDEESLEIPRERFIRADLSQGVKSDRTFDLALSLEVAEHLPESSSRIFVDSLCALAPVVVFSAAIPRQGGTHHVNEQWQDYWAEKFRLNGFYAYDLLRPLIWNEEDIGAHYAQNTIVYVKDGFQNGRFTSQLRVNEPKSLRLVHPNLFLIRTHPTQYSIKGFFLQTIPNYIKVKLGLG